MQTSISPGPQTASERLRQRAAELRERSALTADPPEAPAAILSPGQGTVAVRPAGTTAARSEPVTGARALEMTSLYLRYYVGWPTPAASDVAALWAAHTLARDSRGALLWHATPRLLLTSAENGSGKSSALDLLGYVCRSRFGRLPKVTGPAFAAVMGQFREVALLDEARLVCGANARSQEIQGMIFAGYSKGTHALVMRGTKATAADLFGPIAFAGRDDMLDQPGNTQLVDLIARSIRIGMVRPPRHYPEIGEAAQHQGNILGEALTRWAAVNAESLRSAVAALAAETVGTDVDMLDTGSLRRVQIWRPLLAVAEVAGGEWPERARAAQAELGGMTTMRGKALPAGNDLEALAAVWAAGGEGDEL
jgi:hypothetical protein